MSSLQQQLEAAGEAEPAAAVQGLRGIALGEHPDDAETVKVREAAVQQLADLYAKQGDAAALKQLLVELRPMFAAIPKAKTAKLVRSIIEAIAKVPDSTQLQARPPAAPLAWRTSAPVSVETLPVSSPHATGSCAQPQPARPPLLCCLRRPHEQESHR